MGLADSSDEPMNDDLPTEKRIPLSQQVRQSCFLFFNATQTNFGDLVFKNVQKFNNLVFKNEKK